MAYSGFLLRVGNYQITGAKYIEYSKYNVTRNIQDLDSYRDANGKLHRNALDHVPLKVELETRSGLTNQDIEDFFGTIRANFTVSSERKAIVSVYVPELNDYVTQEMYMPDPQFKIKRIDGTTVYYESIRFAFIGY